MKFSEHYIRKRFLIRGITLDQAMQVVENPVREALRRKTGGLGTGAIRRISAAIFV